MPKSTIAPAPPQLSTAQSVEHINEINKPKPAAAVPSNTAALLIAALASIRSLDQQIAELQIQLDQFPDLEAELVEDRSKSPAEIRAGLTQLRDRASDLKVEQKRRADDRSDALAGAVARFPAGRQLVSAHFNGLYEAEKAKALAAVAPFFVGSTAHAPHILEHLPSVSAAATHAAWCHERVKGENPEDTLLKFVATISLSRLLNLAPVSCVERRSNLNAAEKCRRLIAAGREALAPDVAEGRKSPFTPLLRNSDFVAELKRLYVETIGECPEPTADRRPGSIALTLRRLGDFPLISPRLAVRLQSGCKPKPLVEFLRRTYSPDVAAKLWHYSRRIATGKVRIEVQSNRRPEIYLHDRRLAA